MDAPHQISAADCHIEEHGKVLASAVGVLPLVAHGKVEIGRSFASELHRWFPGHADYLDSAYGGKPIVLHPRRSPA